MASELDGVIGTLGGHLTSLENKVEQLLSGSGIVSTVESDAVAAAGDLVARAQALEAKIDEALEGGASSTPDADAAPADVPDVPVDGAPARNPAPPAPGQTAPPR